jgi:hypothetical protein
MFSAEKKARVLAAVKPGERVLASVVSERLGLVKSGVNKILGVLALEGKLGRERNHHEFLYFRATRNAQTTVAKREPRNKAQVVGAPYPRVLLDVPAADAQIGAALWANARLAMEIRR